MKLELITAGLVLAGGQSRRMGRNKARLTLAEDGPDLLQLMQHKLQQAGCVSVLISGAEVGGLPDRLHEAGPLAGIDAALAALASMPAIAQLLIVPVDMPALPSELLRQLLRAGDGKRAWQFVEQPLPLLLANDASTRQALHALLQTDGPRSLRAFAAALKASTLPIPADAPIELFANLNTPDDWQAWCDSQRLAPASSDADIDAENIETLCCSVPLTGGTS